MGRMSIHIPRVALKVSGLDEATVARALQALPAAISASLASASEAARADDAARAGSDPGRCASRARRAPARSPTASPGMSPTACDRA